MVKLKGPLFSTHASGTIGRLLEYSTHQGRPRAGRRRVPAQPRTLAQRSTRIFVAGLSKAWSAIGIADKASWNNHPDVGNLSPYHVYLRHNIDRYKHLPGRATMMADEPFYPSQNYPTAVDDIPGLTTGHAFVQGPDYLIHSFNVTLTRDNWLYIYHYNVNNGPLPSYADIVAFEVVDANGAYEFTIPNLAPGPSRLRIFRISKHGQTHQNPTTFFFNLTG